MLQRLFAGEFKLDKRRVTPPAGIPKRICGGRMRIRKSAECLKENASVKLVNV